MGGWAPPYCLPFCWNSATCGSLTSNGFDTSAKDQPSGKSPPAATTSGFVHRPDVITGLVRPSCLIALYARMQPLLSVSGISTSARCAPAAVSGPTRSVLLGGYPTEVTVIPSFSRSDFPAAAASSQPGVCG